MRERTSQLLYAYWNEVRGDRVAPRRFDIEPSRITGLLPDTFILERISRAEYLFRLAGTRLCELFGREFRGSNMLGLFDPADAEAIERVLESACKEGAVGVISLAARDREGDVTRMEMLLLPLVHSGLEISRILGSISAGETASKLGHDPIVSLELRSFNLIWPDGRPHALLTKTDLSAPFAREPRHSRIVHSAHRSFRVYEGGRGDELPTEPKR
ncbi:MAG: PAS domain-containing protein [Hyphomicrobiaceae bacterium]